MLIFGLLLVSLIIPAMAQGANSIIVYGSKSCGLTMKITEYLDHEKISYTFYDITEDQSKNAEMMAKLKNSPRDPGIMATPIIDVDGKILSCPPYEELRQALSDTKATNASTQPATKAADPIKLYGRETCGLCLSMRKKLDQAGIPYIFYDVDVDKAKNREMWNKIRESNHGSSGSVRFPIVDIYGLILISPSFDEVKRYL